MSGVFRDPFSSHQLVIRFHPDSSHDFPHSLPIISHDFPLHDHFWQISQSSDDDTGYVNVGAHPEGLTEQKLRGRG